MKGTPSASPAGSRVPLQGGRTSAPGPSVFRGIRQALNEFLALPLTIVIGFVVAGFALPALEMLPLQPVVDVRAWLGQRLLGDAEATAQLLGTVAGSLITVTSITLSILLVAVQQAAGLLTEQVFAQYLRRRLNQFAFGYFVGLAIFALMTLAFTGPTFRPVLSASLTLVLAGVAIFMLIVLIYSAIDQIRGETILGAIHDHALPARERQLAVLQRTLRVGRTSHADPVVVASGGGGYLVGIRLEVIAPVLAEYGDAAEVEILVPLGGYRATGDPVAVVRAAPGQDAAALVDATRRALVMARTRDIESDPAFAIVQLENIGWTTGSSSKQDPATAIAAVRAIRDLIAHWAVENVENTRETEPLAVVLPDDLLATCVGALESLGVVATESMQHHLLAEVFDALAALHPRLAASVRPAAETCIRRLLSGLGDQMLSQGLERSLSELADVLRSGGAIRSGEEIADAVATLAGSIGHLGSRSSRAQGGS